MFPYTGLNPGERIALCGRTGVGKSHWCKWAILRSGKLRWMVLDTKHDPIWDDWPLIDRLPSRREIREYWQSYTHFVIRPRPAENNEAVLDIWLQMIHEDYNRFGLVIDETYQVAFGAEAGPGFTGLITRGRVRGQTLIMGMQRPAWVPRFVFTEARGYCIMPLTTREDLKRVADNVGDRWRSAVFQRMPPRTWLWYDVDGDRLSRFTPVTIWDMPVPQADPDASDGPSPGSLSVPAAATAA